MVAAMKVGGEKRAKDESPVKNTVDRKPKVISQAFSRNGSLRSGRETHRAPVAAATAAGKPSANPMQRPVRPTPRPTDRPFSRWGRNTARAREEGVERGEMAILSEKGCELCLESYRRQENSLSDDITSLLVQVHGIVQGVGFRDFLLTSAQQQKLDGWVRNRSDGTVEALIHGPTKAVELFVSRATKGPYGAKVTAVDLHNSEPPKEKGFLVRPTL